jgi:hypothetical protein
MIDLWHLGSARMYCRLQQHKTDRRGSTHSKDELDAYHLAAPPNHFANPILTAFGKGQFEMIRDPIRIEEPNTVTNRNRRTDC